MSDLFFYNSGIVIADACSRRHLVSTLLGYYLIVTKGYVSTIKHSHLPGFVPSCAISADVKFSIMHLCHQCITTVQQDGVGSNEVLGRLSCSWVI